MAGRAGSRKAAGAVIVVRRAEGGEGGHHGGAWKVAYADFVTAMMAFFLLMWLINATTEEQRRGIADYFSPTNLLGRSVSGSGQPFGGQTPNDAQPQVSTTGAIRIEHGPRPVVVDIEEDDSETPAQPVPWRDAPPGPAELAAGVERPPPRPSPATAGEGADERLSSPSPAVAGEGWGGSSFRDAPNVTGTRATAGEGTRPEHLTDAALRRELAAREREAFERAAEQIREAVRADPALADLARQLLVEQTPEGLRIQVLDAERQPMFALGAAAPNERARALLARVAPILARLPNPVAITGHTDATPFRGGERSNWDLSAERANATRRALVEGGIAEARIRSVAGHAERDPLVPDQPNAAANRRVSITLLRQQPEPR